MTAASLNILLSRFTWPADWSARDVRRWRTAVRLTRRPVASHVLLFAGLAAAPLILLAAYDLKSWRDGLARPSQVVPLSEADAMPPAPEPLVFRPTRPLEAAAINAAIPVSGLPNPAAAPYTFASESNPDYPRSLRCLTSAIYYEAAGESVDGQRAVAQVVLNRVRHAAYPKSVCAVVFQGSERATGCQFTFTCDGSLARVPSERGWRRARSVAQAALGGSVHKPVGWATHYHTRFVVPYWSASLTKLANVDSHIFYRWAGGWGTAGAFRSKISGTEPLIPQLERPLEPAADAAEVATTTEASAEASAEARGAETPLASGSIRALDVAQDETMLESNSIFGAAATSAAARVGAPLGLRVEPESKRAGCRQTSMAAISASSTAPPPC